MRLRTAHSVHKPNCTRHYCRVLNLLLDHCFSIRKFFSRLFPLLLELVEPVRTDLSKAIYDVFLFGFELVKNDDLVILHFMNIIGNICL